MKTSRLLIFLLTLILCLGVLIGCTNKESSARIRIRDLTDIDVPSSAEIMFHDKEEDYFFPVPGRRSQYTVFRFEEYPTDFLSDNNFQDETNDSFEDKFDRELESHMSAEHFNVPDEYYAHWDNEYLWLDTSTGIYFVYFIENHLLIVFVTAT